MNQIVITWEQMNTCIMDWGNKRLMEYICLRLPIEKGIERLELTGFCLTKTKSRVFEPAFFDLGGLRDDFKTMDWVNVKEELGKYSLNNILV